MSNNKHHLFDVSCKHCPDKGLALACDVEGWVCLACEVWGNNEIPKVTNWGCGGCHQNESNPKFKRGSCTICNRKKSQIKELHGFVIASDKQLKDIQDDIRPVNHATHE